MSEAGGPGSAASLTELYRDAIREHAAHPVGFRKAIHATHRHEAYNALCGDRVDIRLRIEGASVIEAAFDGEACAICTASASLLCGLAPGGSVSRLRDWATKLAEALQANVHSRASALPQGGDTPVGGRLRPNVDSRASALPQGGDAPVGGRLRPNVDSRASALPQESDSDLPEALHPLLGVRPYPSRVRCATLPWEAAVTALDEA